MNDDTLIDYEDDWWDYDVTVNDDYEMLGQLYDGHYDD